jgi:hypothetical protein
MDLISISTIWSSQIHDNHGYWLPRTLVITEVLSEFYYEKTLIKEISFGPGLGRAGIGNQRAGPSRAQLKLNRIEWALIIVGSLWTGPGHEKVARFELWRDCYIFSNLFLIRFTLVIF